MKDKHVIYQSVHYYSFRLDVYETDLAQIERWIRIGKRDRTDLSNVPIILFNKE